MKSILDKKQFGNGYGFIDKPVWYSVTVDVPEGTTERYRKLEADFTAVQLWFDSIYEAARRGEPTPAMPDNIKEILWPDSRPVEATPVKQRKQRDTAAASSTASPKT